MENKEIFLFALFTLWYFYPKNLFIRFYNSSIEACATLHFLMNYNKDILKEIEEIKKPEVKYEDKYLNEIRKIDKEFIFDHLEEELYATKTTEFYDKIISDYSYKMSKIQFKLLKIEENLTKREDYYYVSNDEDATNENSSSDLLEDQKTLKNEEATLKEQYKPSEFTKSAEEEAKEFVIKKRLEKLNNCYIIEYTPLGNVLMIYDLERETFKYFSDSSIPYRYLDVVSRKYVKQFACRPLYIDMDDEILLAEEKWKKDKKIKEDEEAKREECIKNQKPISVKKSVFAKFKSYNKEAGTGHVNVAAPPKNSIPNRNMNEKKENGKIILKDKANRYTYEGKIVNFSFIKKPDRKVIDKKFAMTFGDFKKLQSK